MDNELLEMLKRIENKVDKQAQILKELQHCSQINKAEYDKINSNIAQVQGQLWKDN